MLVVPQFTPAFKKKVRGAAAKSTFVFARACLWMKDVSEDFHYELCERLDGRGDWGENWLRGLVVMFRGSLKTSLLRAYVLRRALFEPNWTCRYIGASEENARHHFLGPIENAFRSAATADYLQWLFEEELPPNFTGWTRSWISMRQTIADLDPTISIKGASSSQEGTHVRLVAIDDPEGAEAERSLSEQVDARRVVAHATPLLVRPDRDQILVIATPHGADPITHRLLHQNLDDYLSPEDLDDSKIEWDNAKRLWKVHHKPVRGDDSAPTWPARFDESTIRLIKATTSRDVWNKQYLLKRISSEGGWFDSKLIEKSYAKWKEGCGRTIIQYPAYKVDMEKYRRTGDLDIKIVEREVRIEHLRFYLHFDPKHKEVEKRGSTRDRPARSAVVLVGISPDDHVFVMETWDGVGTLEDQLRVAYRMHMRYGAFKMTSEPIGAQFWVENALKMFERSNPLYQKIQTSGVMGDFRPIPRLSTIHVRDERSSHMSKETVIFERLEPYVTLMSLHLFESQEELRAQILGFPDNAGFLDLLDALAQGPPVWKPPASSKVRSRHKLEQDDLRKVTHAFTGYSSPLRRPGAPRTGTFGTLTGEDLHEIGRTVI